MALRPQLVTRQRLGVYQHYIGAIDGVAVDERELVVRCIAAQVEVSACAFIQVCTAGSLVFSRNR